MVKVFTKNKQGKIEFTESELKKLLDEVYQDGYQDGKGQHVYWYSPPWWYHGYGYDWTWYSPYVVSNATSDISINGTLSGSSISNVITNSDYTTSTSTTITGTPSTPTKSNIDAFMYKTPLDGKAV